MSAENSQQLLNKLQQDIAQTGSMPIYLRFNESLREAIDQGIVKPGDFLPSERAFTDALKISRITVRKALACLEQDDIIGRGRGFGTMVKNVPTPPLAYSLATIKGFSGEVNLQGRIPGSVWLKRERVVASVSVAEKLSIPQNSPVFRLERIRTVDHSPVSVAISYVVEDAIDDVEQIGNSLYDYLRSRRIQFGKLYSQISACLADNELREKLLIKEPSAMLVIRQTLLDHELRPLEYSINYCRGDMYEYSIED